MTFFRMFPALRSMNRVHSRSPFHPQFTDKRAPSLLCSWFPHQRFLPPFEAAACPGIKEHRSRGFQLMFGKPRTSKPAAAAHAAPAAAGQAAGGPTSPQQPSTPHMQHFLRSQQRLAAEAAAAYDAATDDDDLLDDDGDGDAAGRAFARSRGAAAGAQRAAGTVAGAAAGGAGSGSRRAQPRAAAYPLNKHASDAGLAGVAEAAGAAVLAELPDIADWRQALLQTRVVAGTVAVATIGYALLLAPRLLGWRAQWHLLSRFGYDNALAFVLMNLVWIYPQLLASVMWPSFRSSSGSKVQLWRYLAASDLAGSFALLVYLARWSPSRRGHRLPPARLAGRALWLQRLYEGRLWPALLLATALPLLALPFAASAATWAQFGLLARQSWVVHVMCLDLALLTLLAPWLVVRDAAARGWSPASTERGRTALAATMLLLPVLGPAVYLLLRPICKQGPGVMGMLASKAADQLGMGRGRHRGRGSQGRRQGPAGRRSAAAAGVPGGSAAAAGSLHSAVAEAAAVPLPTPMQAALGSVSALLNDAWNWAGQRVAAARGGGPPVAAADEVAGDEMDTDGGDGGVTATSDSHNPFDDLAHAWARQAGGAGAGSRALPADAGLEPPPLQLLLPGGGCELQFDGAYDEEDFELDSAAETDDGDELEEGGSEFSWEQDSSDDDDDDDEDDDEEEQEEQEEAAGDIQEVTDDIQEVTDDGQQEGDEEGLQQSAGTERGVVAAAVAVDEGVVGVGVARFGGGSGGGQLAVSSDTVPLGGGDGGDSQGHSGGTSTRAAKVAAMRLLADLGQQEHPRLAAAAARHS